MAFHLLVFASHNPPEERDELVASKLKDIPPRFAFRRCERPADLRKVVVEAVRDFRAPIHTLDLYDHGKPGHMMMGDPWGTYLFDPYETGHKLASELSFFLTPDAHVRLLGCETALAKEGKLMLVNLQKAFGKNIVVFGTLSKIDPVENFDPKGFLPRSEEARLFSSTEAATLGDNNVAPTYDKRLAQRKAWWKKVG